VLSEILESLQITNKALEEYEQSDTEILTAPVLVTINTNKHAAMPKSMVLDPG